MSFTMFDKFKEVFAQLPKEESKELMYAVTMYGFTGEEPHLDYPLNLFFDLMREDIDNSKMMREIASKGGRPKKQKHQMKKVSDSEKPTVSKNNKPKVSKDLKPMVSDSEKPTVSKNAKPEVTKNQKPKPNQTKPNHTNPNQGESARENAKPLGLIELKCGKPKKSKYGEFQNVLLTDSELAKLQERFPDWQERIESLSAYIEQTGKKYKSHYATILSWAQKDKREAKAQGKNELTEGDVYADISQYENLF